MSRWQLSALAGALLLGAALTLLPVSLGALSPAVAVFCGGPALFFFALAMSRVWPAGLWLALVLLATEQLLATVLSDAVAVDAPLRGAALLWFAELAWLAGQPPGLPPPRAQLLAVAMVGLVGAALGWLVLAMASVPVAGGPGLTGAGVVAVVAVFAAFLWLNRSSRPPQADG
ncbi:MAG: hypothetical protein JF888_11365 [Candidatus Dormibacteraeota bacterium]|uniref:Uncharacterized protein n=1 Tax=Candidatus Dormiibacter inghamiae TaxID=3127013 RepID=A0A934KC61_9BACT|nr:hypothetical protein [Candidatus Dormibacteraeota bacterium]MBJ7607203.1 hypothetical protein [Candidatus Dormibacteraeota bacterium]